MKENIKIAISGKSGCGNSTVSRMTAEKLNLRFINFTFRSIAKERSLELQDILKLAAEDDSIDKEVDTRQVQLAREDGGCVIGSRLAIWMLKEADLKVYLFASPQTRASRIVNREGGRLKDVAAFTEERDKRDQERYFRIYGINTDDYKFADLIIDTDHYMPEKITEMIMNAAKRK